MCACVCTFSWTAYSSPLGRAKLTAELGLESIPKFSSLRNDDEEEEEECYNNNFERNVIVKDWCRELSTWRTNEDYAYQQSGTGTSSTKKNPAIWDFPAPIARSQLHEVSEGKELSTAGWTYTCPDHSAHEVKFHTFCSNLDELLANHGIIRPQPKDGEATNNFYYLSDEVGNNEQMRTAKIAIFCHNGTGLTMLSHLLSIPLPMIYASIWLAPSSVTTVLFDEYPAKDVHTNIGFCVGECNSDDVLEKSMTDIIVTPKAICIGGTNHLTAAGLSVPTSRYEDNERPSGIKHNYY